MRWMSYISVCNINFKSTNYQEKVTILQHVSFWHDPLQLFLTSSPTAVASRGIPVLCHLYQSPGFHVDVHLQQTFTQHSLSLLHEMYFRQSSTLFLFHVQHNSNNYKIIAMMSLMKIIKYYLQLINNIQYNYCVPMRRDLLSLAHCT